MKLTNQIKLQPTKEQAELLTHTIEQANRACNYDPFGQRANGL